MLEGSPIWNIAPGSTAVYKRNQLIFFLCSTSETFASAECQGVEITPFTDSNRAGKDGFARAVTIYLYFWVRWYSFGSVISSKVRLYPPVLCNTKSLVPVLGSWLRHVSVLSSWRQASLRQLCGNFADVDTRFQYNR